MPPPLQAMCYMSDWWFEPTPLKNMKVNWDDDIPNISGKIEIIFSHHQTGDHRSLEIQESLGDPAEDSVRDLRRPLKKMWRFCQESPEKHTPLRIMEMLIPNHYSTINNIRNS